MTDGDKVYPAATKPTPNGLNTTPAGTAATTNPTFPATKAQLYGATRPPYRPQPHHRRRHNHSRSCCCSCCLWSTLAIFIIIFLIAIAGAVFYVLYRPHRPTFTVSALKVTTLNITSSSHLITSINLNVTTRNPNKKLVYAYDPISISVLTGKDDISVGTGSFPSFVSRTKNTTLLKSSITSGNGGQQLDDSVAGKLKSELKSKNGLDLKIQLDTKVKTKVGGLKSPKVRVRVTCEGIKITVPDGKKPTTASTSNVKCKADLRMKIWKWTF